MSHPREIERIRSLQYPEQISIRIEPELKSRIKRLKSQGGVDTAAEIRKAILGLVTELEGLLSNAKRS